jgi:ornithine cyclodeaminase/alanine dehydrogenase
VTLLVSDAEVRELVCMDGLVTAIRAALEVEAAGGVQIVPRINFGIEKGFFRVMPVVIEPLDLMGFKAFDAKLREARYLIAVFRPSTGELDSLVDGAYLTAARTGATTGVATQLMTDEDGCLEVGIVGSGLEARTNLDGVRAVREVRSVKIYSPNPERRERFAADVRERLGLAATAVGSPQEAADAPCVIAATNTGFGGPAALSGEWLRDGAHLNTIGATTPSLREADPATFARAAQIVIDTEHAGPECGDIIAAEQAGMWPQARVAVLTDLIGRAASYRRPSGLTVFKSVGTAVQDLVAAAAVAERARAMGVGREVEILEPKLF